MTQRIEQQNTPNPSIFSADGRLGRLSYAAWLFLVVFLPVMIGVAIYVVYLLSFGVDPAHTQFDTSNTFAVVSIVVIGLITLAIMYMNVILSIKRLHDLDKVGWIFLLNFVPVVGFFFTFYLMYAKGTNDQNTYGSVRKTQTWEKILGWPMLLLPLWSLLITIWLFVHAYSVPVSEVKISEHHTYIEQKPASTPNASAISSS
ncbi:DUF805 domain-containing protein [Acinetobacter sp. B5B]|uniref:DUF805 domain-containing protein n=1 Tax=Acinetobacter baretiae TaxID=2605383 RepID=UPI0018C1DF7B|nr:DUF805 domain-containing protein [Acinetobacter baretiae]MBF7682189.1 DUF805 domain-containing protein [Acinetobacter baretiae]